jgi:hypothetical protein
MTVLRVTSEPIYIDPNYTIFVSNISSYTTITKDTILADNYIYLDNIYKQK